MNKEKYLVPGAVWLLEEGKFCCDRDVNACVIRFANASFVIYSTIRNRYAANESISMNQEAVSKEMFLDIWKPEPDNDMNEIVKDDEEEPVEKWLGKFQIWEPVIPGAEGTLVIIELNDDKVICKQLMNAWKVGEYLDEKVIDFDKDTFTVAFKPTKKQYISSLGITIKDNKVPEESKGLGVFKLNNKGEVVSTKVLGEFTGSENYLKMDGEKAQFETGAIRYTKTGKGRYDLIPESVSDIIMYAQDDYRSSSGYMTTTKTGLMLFAYTNDDIASRFINIVINLVNYYYAPGEDVETIDGIIGKKTTYADFETGWAHMMDDLAKHYEVGAEKYGVDNWKKGIPVIGGDRGGSFADSALRHLNQFCMGKIDEPHQISCIWNCVCGLWTLQEEERKKK